QLPTMGKDYEFGGPSVCPICPLNTQLTYSQNRHRRPHAHSAPNQPLSPLPHHPHRRTTSFLLALSARDSQVCHALLRLALLAPCHSHGRLLLPAACRPHVPLARRDCNWCSAG